MGRNRPSTDFSTLDIDQLGKKSVDTTGKYGKSTLKSVGKTAKFEAPPNKRL